jgi:uncharacterized protein (DUF1800 family)
MAAPDPETVPLPEIHITGGNPNAAEVAAVTAVLQASLAEIAAEQAMRTSSAPSAWQRSQRQLRTPLGGQSGSWRTFSA